MTITSTLIIILVVSAIILGLQFFLSTRKTKWLGLILPVLCFLLASVITIGIVFADSIFQGSDSNSSETATQTDSIMSETDDSETSDETNVTADVTTDLSADTQADTQADTGSDFIYALLIFCLLNIPTMVLTAIYYSTRQNNRVETTMKGK